ncbi:MAG: hypothetical protein ACKVJC_09475, partial [Flavobacteriales bacterium]
MAGLKDGAVAHAFYGNDQAAVVSWEYGQGRVVNLGQVYMGNIGYETDSLITNESSFNLLTNSIDWASGNTTDEDWTFLGEFDGHEYWLSGFEATWNDASM